MLFHTWDFVIYFTLVMGVYSLIMKTRFRIPFLWIVSYIFYGWWDFRFLLLIFTLLFFAYSYFFLAGYAIM